MVFRGLPLTASVMPETKFVPVTVMVPAGEPTRTLEGARAETVGTGLLHLHIVAGICSNDLLTVHDGEFENRAVL